MGTQNLRWLMFFIVWFMDIVTFNREKLARHSCGACIHKLNRHFSLSISSYSPPTYPCPTFLQLYLNSQIFMTIPIERRLRAAVGV